MVAISDIRRANALYREQRDIGQGLAAIAQGERITSMTLGTVLVSAEHIATPPQMMDAIRLAMVARQDAIAGELQSLGVDTAPMERRAS